MPKNKKFQRKDFGLAGAFILFERQNHLVIVMKNPLKF